MAKHATKRNLNKEDFWRRAIRQQGNSGQSVRVWCREQGQSEASFYYWRCALTRRDAEHVGVGTAKVADRVTQTGPAAFVPICVAEANADNGESRIEICLTDGRRVRLSGPVNRRMLAEVLDVLERSPC